MVVHGIWLSSIPSRSLLATQFRVYLGVRTCELFLCFAPFVFLGFSVSTSLFPLLYVTREFHRFVHRRWALIHELTTHFDSEDDYRTGCRNVSQCQQQQSYSGLRSPGRSNSTYFWNDSLVQTFHKKFWLRNTFISAHSLLANIHSSSTVHKCISEKS